MNKTRLLGCIAAVLLLSACATSKEFNDRTSFTQTQHVETFGHIMGYIPTSQFKCQVREGEGRCIITVENVKNVETALAFVEEIERHSIAPY